MEQRLKQSFDVAASHDADGLRFGDRIDQLVEDIGTHFVEHMRHEQRIDGAAAAE